VFNRPAGPVAVHLSRCPLQSLSIQVLVIFIIRIAGSASRRFPPVLLGARAFGVVTCRALAMV
jgi:hypothetical protein